MNAVDEVVGAALRDAYPQADATGVAELVRARVAAGDTGLIPPGGSGAAWLPWIGGGLAVGLAAGIALSIALGGGAALLNTISADDFGTAGSGSAGGGAVVSSTLAEVDALTCPNGAPSTTIPAGSRVLAIARSEDDAWIGIRDPLAPGSTVWVSAAVITADAGQAPLESLELGGCGAVELVAAPAHGQETVPSPPTPPPGESDGDQAEPAPDTTAPTIGAATVTYSPAQGFVCTENAASIAIIAVSASDSTGISSVNATWAGSQPGSAALTPSAGQWRLDYRPTNLSITETIPFTIVATDASGNQSGPAGITVQRDQCPG